MDLSSHRERARAREARRALVGAAGFVLLLVALTQAFAKSTGEACTSRWECRFPWRAGCMVPSTQGRAGRYCSARCADDGDCAPGWRCSPTVEIEGGTVTAQSSYCAEPDTRTPEPSAALASAIASLFPPRPAPGADDSASPAPRAAPSAPLIDDPAARRRLAVHAALLADRAHELKLVAVAEAATAVVVNDRDCGELGRALATLRKATKDGGEHARALDEMVTGLERDARALCP